MVVRGIVGDEVIPLSGGMQVMENTLKWMVRVPGQQVFRARFSAISAPEILAAMVRSRAALSK